jgi:hypothetical protein
VKQRLFLICILSLSWFWFSTGIADTPNKLRRNVTLITHENLISLIQAIKKEFPFKDLATCNRTMSILLKEANSNDSFTTYVASKSRDKLVKSVELRTNFKVRPNKQLLIVKLARPISATTKDFEIAFGIEGKFMGHTTSHMKTPKTYSTYKFLDMEIRVTSDQKGKVVDFVMDSF